MGHSDSKDYTHTKPMGFKLEGETHTGDGRLKDWNDLLLAFFEALYRRNNESFRSLLELKTSAGNPVLARDPEKHFENRDWVLTEPQSKNKEWSEQVHKLPVVTPEIRSSSGLIQTIPRS